MPKDKLLALDLTNKETSLQILPYVPILSSDKLGWNGIYLKDYHRLPPHELPEYFPAQHLILTHNHQHPVKIERILDGRLQSELMASGDIVIVPANVSHGANWKTEIDITVMVLEPAFFAQMAYESIEPQSVELIPHFSRPDPLIFQIAQALKTELKSDGLYSRLYAESAATMLGVHLLRRYSGQTNNFRQYSGGLPQYKLRQTIEYINEHLTEDLSLQAIANEVGMSRYHFTRMFKQSTGRTPHQYLIERRIERAKTLLCNTDLAIADIAHLTGFASQSHLTKLFRKHLSTTPKAYRQML